jgi:hypothetical protein
MQARRALGIGILPLLFTLLTAAGMRAPAQDMPLPVAVQYELFVKILSYDRNLAPRAADAVVIAVVFQRAVRPSRAAADEFVAAVGSSTARAVHGLPIRAVRVELTDTSSLDRALVAAGANVAYLAPLRATNVGDLLHVTQRLGILTMTGVPAYVEAGVAVGLGVRNGKPQIMVNLPGARAGGADLAAPLLSIAEVRR